jgi:hypothetical protein
MVIVNRRHARLNLHFLQPESSFFLSNIAARPRYSFGNQEEYIGANAAAGRLIHC